VTEEKGKEEPSLAKRGLINMIRHSLELSSRLNSVGVDTSMGNLLSMDYSL